MKSLVTQCMVAVLSLATTFSLGAQNSGVGTIHGKVLDPEGSPVEYANVILRQSTDSSLIKVEYTDQNGVFNIAGITQGEYLLEVSYVGMPTYLSPAFQVVGGQDTDLSTIALEESAVDLTEVEVTGQRPILEIQPDKMVLNVDKTINATGSDGLELLRKSPGVVVDNNESITLLGRSGVRIFIDGKPSPLRGADLANYLKSLQSTDIDAIEIITNPSSKYDAEGNAGIINIRLKKDKSLGANANVNLGYSVGELARYNGSVNGNYRNKSFNTFANYSYNDGRNVNFMNIYRQQFGFVFDQTGRNFNEWRSHNFKGGLDLFLNKKSTLGFMVSGNLSDNTWNANARSTIGREGVEAIDSILVADSFNEGDRNNANFNLNYRFDNTQGTVWNVDADYGLFRNQSESYQPNRYLNPAGDQLLLERITTNNTPTDINIYTFKLDHERTLGKGKLGAGVKFAYVETDNTFDFFNVIDGQEQLNIDRSNNFVYRENVNAAYLNFSQQMDKFSFQVGLRAEQTNSTGDLTAMKETENDHVERNYLDLFPSASLTFSPSQKHTLQLSYSRRINRPSYQDLNPFENQLNELTFQRGNPFLQPEYANNFQLTHTYNYRFNTTLSYSHTRDLITQQTDAADDKASFITWLNLADQYNYSLNISAPVSITQKWSTFTSLTAYYQENIGDFGEGKVIDLSAQAFNIYMQHTIQMPAGLTFEVSGWYNSPSLWGGNFEMESMWNMDAGIQRKVFDGRGTLKLSVSDIFKTTNWHGVSQFGPLYMNIAGGWDSRRFRLNFSYLLGNTQVKGARKRNTGLEDEQSRIKSDS